MAGNLLDLAERLDRKAAELGEVSSDHAVKVALTVVGHLAYHTPVDESVALSNWQVTLDAPAIGTIDAHVSGSHGSTQKASAAETLNRAKAVLANKTPGQSIFITNNVPYIGVLNDGTHSQQPGGFVERAMLLARKMKGQFKLRK